MVLLYLFHLYQRMVLRRTFNSPGSVRRRSSMRYLKSATMAALQQSNRKVRITSSKLIKYNKSHPYYESMDNRYKNGTEEVMFDEWGLRNSFIGGMWILPKRININNFEKCIEYSLVHFPWFSSRLRYTGIANKKNNLSSIIEHNNAGVELNIGSYDINNTTDINNIINDISNSLKATVRDQYMDVDKQRKPKNLYLFDDNRGRGDIVHDSAILSLQITQFNNTNSDINRTRMDEIVSDLNVLSFSASNLIADTNGMHAYLEYLSQLMDEMEKMEKMEKMKKWKQLDNRNKLQDLRNNGIDGVIDSKNNDDYLQLIPDPKPRFHKKLPVTNLENIPNGMRIESYQDFNRVYDQLCNMTAKRKYNNYNLSSLTSNYSDNLLLNVFPLTLSWKMFFGFRDAVYSRLKSCTSHTLELYLSNNYISKLKNDYTQAILKNDENTNNCNNKNDLALNLQLSTFEVITGWLIPKMGKIESKNKKFGKMHILYPISYRNININKYGKYDCGNLESIGVITNAVDNTPIQDSNKQSWRAAYNLHKYNSIYKEDNINYNEIANAHLDQLAYVRNKTYQFSDNLYAVAFADITRLNNNEFQAIRDLQSLHLLKNFKFGTKCNPIQYLTSTCYNNESAIVLPTPDDKGVGLFLTFEKKENVSQFLKLIKQDEKNGVIVNDGIKTALQLFVNHSLNSTS